MSKKLDFEWTESEYSLKGFLETFAHQLPVVISVTEGWGGFSDTTFEYGAGEVYRICGIKKQHRVIARESSVQGRCFGIPLDHPMEFNLRRKDSRLYTDPMPISTIVRDYMRKTNDRLVIFLADPDPDTRLHYWNGPEKEDTLAMVELELEQCYEEKYLLAHSVTNNGLLPVTASHCDDSSEHHTSVTGRMNYSEFGSLSIPAYLPIKVAVATGLENGTMDEFQKVMYDMYMTTRTWNIQKAIVNKGILLYHPYNESGNYDYIAPKVFLNVDHTKPPDMSAIKSTESPIYGAFSPRQPFEENRRKQEKPLPPLPGEEAPLVDDSEYEVQLHLVDIPDIPLEIGHNELPERPEPLPRRPLTSNRSQSMKKSLVSLPNVKPLARSKTLVPSHTGTQKRHGPLPKIPMAEKQQSVTKASTTPSSMPPSPSKGSGDTTVPTGKGKHKVLPKHIEFDKPLQDKPQLAVSPTAIQQRRSMLFPVPRSSIQTPPSSEQVYGDLCEVPQDIRHLTVQQLADCLQKLKLGQYANAFIDQNIDGELLYSMADQKDMSEMMAEIFHMKKLESLKLWKFAHDNWRPK